MIDKLNTDTRDKEKTTEINSDNHTGILSYTDEDKLQKQTDLKTKKLDNSKQI